MKPYSFGLFSVHLALSLVSLGKKVQANNGLNCGPKQQLQPRYNGFRGLCNKIATTIAAEFYRNIKVCSLTTTTTAIYNHGKYHTNYIVHTCLRSWGRS
jgi:hypothetical protein